LVGGGLAGVAGNSVKFGGNGTSARFNLGSSSATGSWYFSFLVRLTDITGLSAGGIFWAGFNNSSGSQTTTPNTVGTRVVARAAGGGYQIGLDKTSGATGQFVFDPRVFTTNDTLLLVGGYTFNPATTTDDVSELWINPPASTFGLASPPPATLASSATNDLSQIASFVLFNRNVAEPAVILADEVRVGASWATRERDPLARLPHRVAVGASWASVTPPAEVGAAPALILSQFGNTSVLAWLTNAPGFLLEASPALSDANSWAGVIAPVYLVGGQFVVTNNMAGGNLFYRLRKP
jgi:hypothetical protein